jgi:hypothetical protein
VDKPEPINITPIIHRVTNGNTITVPQGSRVVNILPSTDADHFDVVIEQPVNPPEGDKIEMAVHLYQHNSTVIMPADMTLEYQATNHKWHMYIKYPSMLGLVNQIPDDEMDAESLSAWEKIKQQQEGV